MKLKQIEKYISEYLNADSFAIYDPAKNGIQFSPSSSSDYDINRIAIAVDASLDMIKMADACRAELLLTHHGIYWGRSEIQTILQKKVCEQLQRIDCSLMSYHLPLDAHMEVGNNIQLANKVFELQNITPFGKLGNNHLGIRGEFKVPLDIFDIINKFEYTLGGSNNIKLLDNTARSIYKTVAIVSGAGGSYIEEAKENEIDLLITGEIYYQDYNLAKDITQDVLYFGHHETETLGVIALANHLKNKCSPGELEIFNLMPNSLELPRI